MRKSKIREADENGKADEIVPWVVKEGVHLNTRTLSISLPFLQKDINNFLKFS